MRNNWERSKTGPEIEVYGPIELWQVRLVDDAVESPKPVFQSSTQPDEPGAYYPEQIQFGQWSPNNRYLLFWHGMLSASILATGRRVYRLEPSTGEHWRLNDVDSFQTVPSPS